MNKFDVENFINKLVCLGERQLELETKAFQLIAKTLKNNSVDFCVQEYTTYVPKNIEAILLVDNKNIEAIPTCFVSGKIDTSNIISSLTSSQSFIKTSNINFSPVCKSISRNNHYFAPSLAVDKKNVTTLLSAKKILASVKVKKTKHKSNNILVGNLINPKNILFCHYDSISTGAVDNASGTAMLMKMIIDYSMTLQDNLYVIAGNEELSYDYPVYWGHGYRVFEKKYKKILDNAKNIFIVDCIGNDKPKFDNNMDIIKLGFPIQGLKKRFNNIFMVYGDLNDLMSIYHSDLDTIDKINKKYLSNTLNSLLEKIK